jgi:hypothetical protein
MIAVEVQGRDPKITWEIVGIYRTPNKDMQLLQKINTLDWICVKNYKA